MRTRSHSSEFRADRRARMFSGAASEPRQPFGNSTRTSRFIAGLLIKLPRVFVAVLILCLLRYLYSLI